MKRNQASKDDEREWDFFPDRTPFTERILEAECPKKFNPPTLPPYNGLVDPNYSLFKYEWHMSTAKATNEMRCTYFPL